MAHRTTAAWVFVVKLTLDSLCPDGALFFLGRLSYSQDLSHAHLLAKQQRSFRSLTASEDGKAKTSGRGFDIPCICP
jgi:hypothetical protein